MSKLACAFALIALATATTAAAQSAVPDLRGTWKGESESIVLGGGNAHHTVTSASEPELRSIAFTLTIDKQDGRRFSGTFSSPRGGSKIVAVMSRGGTLLGRRRGLKWDHAGARPHRTLLSQARTGRAHCLLLGIDETAVGKRPPLHHIIA